MDPAVRRREEAALEFARLARKAAKTRTGHGLSEDQIVAAVKRTRETIFRKRYVDGPPSPPDPAAAG